VKQTLSESQLRFSRLGVAHDVDEQDVADLEPYVGELLRWDSHLLRSDVFLASEQLLEAGIVAERVPDRIDS
jgi:hypothetical protein